jgi:hypothetical protein
MVINWFAEITANGPAIKGVCVPAFWNKKRDGEVFGIMVQIFGLIRVSRYKADRKQVGSHLIVILLTVLAQYRGTSLQRSRERVMVQEFDCEHWSAVQMVRFKGHVIRKQ